MPLKVPLPKIAENWTEEKARAEVKSWLGADVLSIAKLFTHDFGEWSAGNAWHYFLNSLTEAIEWVNSAIVAFTPAAMKLAASTIHQITGIQIDAARLGEIAQGAAGREQMIEVGAAFHPVLDQMFPINDTAAKTVDRSTRAWAIDNVNAYFGTNMLFQLRSLTIATIASFVPGSELRHLEGLHQSINWAYGFGWLSWTVMSSIMDVTTTKPLKEHYNRLIKPEDLTPQRAIQAYLTGQIDRRLLETIMDNEGLRDDVRQIEIDLQEKDLSDSQLRTMWEYQQVDRDYILKAQRLKSYGEERAKWATDLLTQERLIKLQEEYVTRQRRLFVDCVIEENELRQVLVDAHYYQDEVNQVVLNDLTARRQRTFLPTADMVKAIKAGLLDINDAMQALQCRGWTYDDAVVELLLKLQDKLPPCEDVKLEEKAMIGLLQALGTSLGISGKFLKPNVLKYLQCLNAEFLLLPPVATLTADKTTIEGEGRVVLTWKTQLATTATIEPVLGPVPLSGETGVTVKHSQGFKLHAHSPIGDTYATVFINVVPLPPI